MASAFEYAADQYALYIAKNDRKQADKITIQALNTVDKLVTTIRESKTMLAEIQEDVTDKLLYPIESYKKWFRIGKDYWETMKRLQEKVSYNLTQEEYDYVNQQIESIISQHIFKSSMGLKIFDA
jgi:hypothetical protein